MIIQRPSRIVLQLPGHPFLSPGDGRTQEAQEADEEEQDAHPSFE